jgi:hypothetical protein
MVSTLRSMLFCTSVHGEPMKACAADMLPAAYSDTGAEHQRLPYCHACMVEAAPLRLSYRRFRTELCQHIEGTQTH